MARLTRQFLEEHGFSQSNGMANNYRSRFSKHFDDYEWSISFLSTLGVADELAENYENEEFDVLFCSPIIEYEGQTNRYATVESHMRISTTEQFEMIINSLIYEKEDD